MSPCPKSVQFQRPRFGICSYSVTRSEAYEKIGLPSPKEGQAKLCVALRSFLHFLGVPLLMRDRREDATNHGAASCSHCTRGSFLRLERSSVAVVMPETCQYCLLVWSVKGQSEKNSTGRQGHGLKRRLQEIAPGSHKSSRALRSETVST